MDWFKRAIAWTLVLAFFVLVFSGSATASTGPDEGQTYSYRIIEDRRDAMGNHPVLLENPGAHDPSYQEVMDFLKTDDTVKHEYRKPEYTCANFAEDLQNNAEGEGLNCGYASLKFRGKDNGHALDVFNTVDQGPVYVDTTSGKAIVSRDLEPGDTYYNLGVIAKVTEYW